MSKTTAFLESLHYVPEPGWTRAAFSVLRAGKVAAAADYRVVRAFHSGQDVLYCLSGSGFVETLGRRLEVKPGQLVWISNEAPHAHSADPGSPWTVLWFRLDGPDPVALREKLFGDGVARVTFDDVVDPVTWFERLFSAMRSRDPGLDLRLNHLVAEFLDLIHRASAGDERNIPAPLAAVLGAMRANLGVVWSATDLSAVTGLGQSQTRRLFRRHLRTSPRQWLIRERVMHAQSLLAEGSAPLTEIAEACGFCDVYHFGREFKRSVGIAPAAWRRSEIGARPAEGGSHLATSPSGDGSRMLKSSRDGMLPPLEAR